LASEGSVVYFDGTSSRRHVVALGFNDQLDIREHDHTLAAWSYADIRRADSPAGTLRVTCLTAPVLARLEIHGEAVATRLIARCPRLDESLPGRHGVAAIVGWSLAATVSIVLMVLFGIPLLADRLTPLMPQALERRLGDVAEGQVKAVFAGKVCDNAAGLAAFAKLMAALRGAAGLDTSIDAVVVSSPVANAFALPGGKVFLLKGLLVKADDADEIAGVLAHELGHVRHRDSMRELIASGGSSFLIGLLFGDITGSSALIFASRSMVTAAYSREAEDNADAVSIEVMHRLGRSSSKLGELLFRVTGNEANKGVSILANHPLTEDRLARMRREDAAPSGPPLLTPAEWASLKAVCQSESKS
jgi:Zn-dependent protease with chaperone function